MEHEYTDQGTPSLQVLPHPHSFTLRLWEEQLGGGEAEWRGRVQDIGTAETHYFRGWPGLVSLLSQLVTTAAVDHPSSDIVLPSI